jgi:hypothetical protein
MYSSRMTFEIKEHEEVPGETQECYYEHTYVLEISLDEDYVFEADEFIGTVHNLIVDASHYKTYKRDGKLLREYDLDENIEFTIPDPGKLRIAAVVSELLTYFDKYPWVEKLVSLV